MQLHRRIALLPLLLTAAGCSLYSDVSIKPLMLNPAMLERGVDLASMVKKSDFLRALEAAPVVDAKIKKSVHDLLNLGLAELASGRYDDSRRHLRAALDLAPFRDTSAQIEWALSQLEYLCNNYEASREWAEAARDHGLAIRKWHLDYLASLSGIRAYHASGLRTSRVAMHHAKPEVPRIEVRMNGEYTVTAIIDSGAALSIASQRLADQLPIRRLGDFSGTFLGLLGEPIPVQFGILDSLTIGDIVMQNVPVAIMPDDKMKFAVGGKREFRMDFLIGANFLKEFRTELDFARSTATFTYLTSADRRPVADQNLFIHGFRPFVRATVNRRGWYVFVLDTGSEITFLNDAQLPSMPINQLGPRAHSATLQGLGGAKKRGTKLEDVEIGVDRWAGTFRTLPTYSASEHENAAGILGENFLMHFRVVLDFGRMRLDLLKGSRSAGPPPPSVLTAAGNP